MVRGMNTSLSGCETGLACLGRLAPDEVGDEWEGGWEGEDALE